MKRKIAMTMILCTMLVGCGNVNSTVNDTAVTEESATKQTDYEKNSNLGDVEIKGKISDFNVSVDLIQEENVDGNTVVNINNGVAFFKINPNNQEQIKEINFYSIPDYMDVKDLTIDKREYVASFYDYNSMDKLYLRYDLPEKPNLLVSFVMKNNQVFEYYAEKKGDSISLVKMNELNADELIQYIEEEN